MDNTGEKGNSAGKLNLGDEIFMNAGWGIVLADPVDNTIVACNPAFAEMHGWFMEEMTGRDLADTFAPESRPDLPGYARSVHEKGRHTYESVHVRKDGTTFPTLADVYLIRDDSGNVRYRTAHVQDITERKKALETLQRNEQVLRLFVEHSPAAIAMFDNDMNYIVASRRFLVDYDLGEQNIIGRSHYEVFPEIPDYWKDIHRRCLAGATERAKEDPFPRADGKTDWVRWEIRPWYESEGEIGGIILFSEVITDRRKAEEELGKYRNHLEDLVSERTKELEDTQKALTNIVEDLNMKTSELEQANKKLLELDQLKSMFIASMSHELRTPLNSIIGFTGMTLQGLSGELNEEQRDNLSRAFRSAKHLLALISDVIDISKIEAGRVDVFIDKFGLGEVVGEAVTSILPQLKEKGLSVEVNIKEALKMRTDRKRLLQCLINFLSNAVKFTETGEITVTSREINGCVELSVMDTGIGIEKEDIPKLFEAFERLNSRLRVKAGGTGLGLYLTKKLAAEVLQGAVFVQSEAGKGSTFSIRLPINLELIHKSSSQKNEVQKI